jgi:predicted nucleotide-binding protein (sugar kinase/HSP70/actin superfamily)
LYILINFWYKKGKEKREIQGFLHTHITYTQKRKKVELTGTYLIKTLHTSQVITWPAWTEDKIGIKLINYLSLRSHFP